MIPLLLGSLACGGVGLAVLLPRPGGPAHVVGLALLALAAIGVTVSLWTRLPEAGGATAWLIAGVGTATVLAAIAAVLLPGARGLHAYVAASAGVALLLGLVADWTIGLSSAVMQGVVWLRLRHDVEQVEPAASAGDATSEPFLAAVGGTLLAAVLLVPLVTWSPAAASGGGSPPLDPDSRLVVMGGVLLLIGLAFVGLADDIDSVSSGDEPSTTNDPAPED